jgi:hypothetical protein
VEKEMGDLGIVEAPLPPPTKGRRGRPQEKPELEMKPSGSGGIKRKDTSQAAGPPKLKKAK